MLKDSSPYANNVAAAARPWVALAAGQSPQQKAAANGRLKGPAAASAYRRSLDIDGMRQLASKGGTRISMMPVEMRRPSDQGQEMPAKQSFLDRYQAQRQQRVRTSGFDHVRMRIDNINGDGGAAAAVLAKSGAALLVDKEDDEEDGPYIAISSHNSLLIERSPQNDKTQPKSTSWPHLTSIKLNKVMDELLQYSKV